MDKKWVDVQDSNGIWRVGFEISVEKNNQKLIGLDGFHPNYNLYYCTHSGKLEPIRTHTYGLTTPTVTPVLRSPLQNKQLQAMIGRITIYMLSKKFHELQPQAIRNFFRTQFLILIDKIFMSPFQIIKDLRMIDLTINKLFINFVDFYIAFIDNKTSETAHELYNSVYQLTIILSMILGLHSRSKSFYCNKENMTIKCEGYTDLLKAQGILIFKLLLKNITQIKNINQKNLMISKEVINLILDLCQRDKNQFIQGKLKEQTAVVIEEIISHLKQFAEKSQKIKDLLAEDVGLISRIQSCYSKLKPKKQCTLRKILDKNKQQPMNINLNQDNEKITKLEERIIRMEALLAEKQKQPKQLSFQNLEKSQIPKLPVENLGQQMFLGSLQWVLENNDNQTARKLVKWRRSLLQIGRITGWQVALNIGYRTFKKGEISHQDIIEANYQYLMRNSLS